MLKNTNSFSLLRLFSIFFLAVTMGGCAVCPCKNLTKVTSQDDLFGQIYETALNDSCLFKMTAEELQNIWEIPVVENDAAQGGYYNVIRKNAFFDGSELHSPIGIYVIRTVFSKDNRNFFICATDAYLREHKTLFPGNALPKTLPSVKRDINPSIKKRLNPSIYIEENVVINRDDHDFFRPGYVYYWKGDRGMSNRMLFYVRHSGVIEEVGVYTPASGLADDLK